MYRKRVAVKNTAALIDFYGNVHYNFFIRLIGGLEMRDISCHVIRDTIQEMCIQATHFLSDDMAEAMNHAIKTEESPLGKQVLKQLEDNLKIAGEEMIPICQDTGMAILFVEMGQF